jgi:hypothetical protein
MKPEIMKTILYFLLIMLSAHHARAQRVIEISGNSRRLLAQVELFRDAKDSNSPETKHIAGERFAWFDIPAEYGFARIKVGELKSDLISLTEAAHTYVEVGLPKVGTDSAGLSRAYLDLPEVSPRIPVPAGKKGWVYLGQLDQSVRDGKSSWKSLYLVKKDGAAFDGDYELMKTSLTASDACRMDFPLYLRQEILKDDSKGLRSISRTPDDPIVRAGQWVKALELKEPDKGGNVWVYVEILTTPENLQSIPPG